MPTPFMCHWCDKPTLEKSGICIKCEQAYEEGNKNIASTVRELETRIRWYEDALKEIIKCCDLRDNYGMIEDISKTALDGEPTTADVYNRGDDDENDNVPVITGDRDTDALLEDERIAQEELEIEYNFISPHDPGDENDNV